MGIIKALKWGSQFKKEDVYRPGCFNPGLFQLDKAKTQKLRPGFYNPLRTIVAGQCDNPGFIGALLNDGDIQTAVVVSENPLLVACYSEDMDAVILQCYPVELGQAKGWDFGTRLLTTAKYNGYGTARKNKDIFPGPNADPKMKSFGPVIAELYSDEPEYLERKTSEIPEELWEKTMALGMKYLEEHPGMARNGLGDCFKNATQIEKIKFNPKSKFD